VVAVGLTFVEPLADVDVNVPGVMAMEFAPFVAQFSVVLAPEFMLAGFAVKDMTVGTEPLPGGWLDELIALQLVSAKLAIRARTRAQRFRPGEAGFW